MKTSRVSSLRGLVVLFTLVPAGCAPVDEGSFGQVDQSIQQCQPATVLEGVDVYDGNGTINWASAHGAGLRFAIMKATQGTGNTQSTFASSRANAHSAGVYVSPYHFFDPTIDGAAQARHFLSVVGSLGAMDLPAMLDVECPDGDANCLGYTGGSGTGASAAQIRSRMLAWLQAVETATGRIPMIYTFGAYFSSNHIDTTGLERYPLFIAFPTVTSHCSTGGGTCFNVPSPWTHAAFWQWTWHGCVSGIPGEVDRDRFMGSETDLMTFATGHAPDWAAQYVSQSFPLAADGALDVPTGGSRTVSLTMKNVGAHAWDEHTCLATTNPRDRISPLAGPEWHAANRPACVPAGTTVAAGANYTFSWQVHGGTMPIRVDEHWGFVEEGGPWFSDTGQGGPADDVLEGLFDVVPGDAGVDDDAGSVVQDSGSNGDATVRDAGSDAGGMDGGGETPMHGGCGCTVPGTRSHRGRTAGAWTAVLFAAVALRRRKRG